MKVEVVVENIAYQTDWGRNRVVRLDCKGPAGTIHVYVSDGHPLAGVLGGSTLVIQEAQPTPPLPL